MNQFKVGDKVRRTEEGGNDISYGVYVGKIYTVSRSGGYIALEGISGLWGSECFDLVEKEPESQKHVHADLIIAWANGAIIEQQNFITKIWAVVKTPSWAVNSNFRLKVNKPEFQTFQRRVTFNLSQNPDHSYLTWYPDGTPNVEVTVKTETGEVVKIVQI
jgi:hypothetical protein